MVSQMQHFSLLGNINCTDSGTYRKSHCASNLLLLTLYREISYHYSVVIPAGSLPCWLLLCVERESGDVSSPNNHLTAKHTG